MIQNRAQNHTDIKSDSRIINIIPHRLRPYALLMRLDRPAGTWLLLLPCWWSLSLATGGFKNLDMNIALLFGLFAVGAIIMRGAGCVINDLWDRDIDKQVTRTAQRPLASGAISMKEAAALLIILLSIGFLILIQLPLIAILLGFLTVPLIAIYPLMKRITWWPQLFLGITFNFGALIGWAAINDSIALSALLIYSGGIFWTLGYDTIYAHQDKEDDMRVGIKSSARKLGSNSIKGVSVFYSLAGIFFGAGFILANAGALSLIVLCLAFMQLGWQIKTWDMNNPESSLETFKSNRNFGLLVLCAALI